VVKGDYDLVDRSAILELATYVICDEKTEIKEGQNLKSAINAIKDELQSEGTLSPEQAQNLKYIEQVELAMKKDPTIGEVTVLRTSFGKSKDYDSPMAAVCFKDNNTVFVQYQGTPKSGWVQNPISYGAYLSEYMADDGISSKVQADGLKFFELCVEDFVVGGQAAGLVVGGHSQGGNVAEYITMMSQYGEQIDLCVALDAPNHSEKLEAHVKAKLGDDRFAEQTAKIVAISGNNDFVNMQGQVSFATKEYYINTNEAWAKENGHEGVWGYHDMLYMMDRGYGGLIPTKEKYEAMEQEAFWEKLALEEYVGFLAYLSAREQKEFLSKFPPQQQEQLSAMIENEQKKLKKPESEMEITIEYEKKKSAPAKMAQAMQSIEEKKQNAMFWDTLPIDEYVEFLAYLTPMEQAAFLSVFPAKYREQIQKQLSLWQPRPWDAPKTIEQKLAKREQALAARNRAQEDIRVKSQCYALYLAQTGEQGAFGKFMTELVAAILALPDELRKDSALTMMGILELALGSKLLDDLFAIGLSEYEIMALIEYGLPAIYAVIANNADLLAEALPGFLPSLLKGALTDKLKEFLDDSFVDGLPPDVIESLCHGLSNTLSTVLKMAPGSAIHGFLKKENAAISALAVLGPLEKYLELIEGKTKETRSEHKKSIIANMPAAYADENPCIKVDTDKLRGYAERVNNIISRLRKRAEEVGELLARERAKPEEERDESLIEAYQSQINRLGEKIPDMEKLIKYFYNVSEIFERVEEKVVGIIDAFTKG